MGLSPPVRRRTRTVDERAERAGFRRRRLGEEVNRRRVLRSMAVLQSSPLRRLTLPRASSGANDSSYSRVLVSSSSVREMK